MLDLPFVDASLNKYLNNNPNHDSKQDWMFSANGHQYRKITNMLCVTHVEMAWIECMHISDEIHIDMNIFNGQPLINGGRIHWSRFQGLLKITALYKIHYYNRKGWSVVWSTQLPKTDDGSTPPCIHEMQDNFRKAFNLAKCFVPGMVCFIVY